MRSTIFAGLVLAATLMTGAAQAAVLQTQTPQGLYPYNSYGSANWATFNGYLDGQFTVNQSADFTAIGSGTNALLINQELGNTLDDTEIATIQGFIAAGGKALFIGENDSWANWNTSILAVVGGTANYVCSWVAGAPSVANSLTDGVSSVAPACASQLTTASGNPTILFDNGLAGLYRFGAGQALFVMDSNIFDNGFISGGSNTKFAQNVAGWLATPLAPAPVPLPAGLPLMLAGIAGLAALRRKKKA